MFLKGVLKVSLILLFLLFSSPMIFEGKSAGNGNSPNPTGGFGQTDNLTNSNPNPTGGFGNSGNNNTVTPLGIPPPPPDPIPLDGGAGLVLLTAIGIGVRKLYKNFK